MTVAVVPVVQHRQQQEQMQHQQVCPQAYQYHQQPYHQPQAILHHQQQYSHSLPAFSQPALINVNPAPVILQQQQQPVQLPQQQPLLSVHDPGLYPLMEMWLQQAKGTPVASARQQ